MDWLTNNAIGNMHGPDFLWLFGIYSVIVLIWCKTRVDRIHSDAPPLPPIPISPDPYEIAYLRGGAREVLWVALFTLSQKGYFNIVQGSNGATYFEPTANIPHAADLQPVERIIYSEFARSSTSPSIYRRTVGRINILCHGYSQSLISKGLLESPETMTAQYVIGSKAIIAIIALGGYKLFVALSNGHSNVGFLLLIGVVASVFIGVFCSARPTRLRREAYLHRLHQAYGQLRGQASVIMAPDRVDENAFLLVGLFGMEVLSDTLYYTSLNGMYNASMRVVPPVMGGGCSSC
ncbi:MAG: TIGR04222 domain-containing membrane protein, partial [Armatimonadetes bacterium]|nr:TIGR04222 domain-containing membrane protein [Armatimonadota bacterium]